jgi:hypothetical protein
MSYAAKLKDPRWQKRRLHILNQRGWKCERCKDDKTTLHVHHLRYRGEPWEAMDHDLQVLCEVCHDVAHGKQQKSFKVYFAGKIAMGDWRHSLFEDLRDAWSGECCGEANEEGPEGIKDTVFSGVRVNYAGPFFVSDDHGCFHGATRHGQLSRDMEENGNSIKVSLDHAIERRSFIFERCMSWMYESDALFCWVDGEGAYGSIVEAVLFASAYKKPVAVAFASEELLLSYWFFFLRVMAYSSQNAKRWSDWVQEDVSNFVFPNAREALEKCLPRLIK